MEKWKRKLPLPRTKFHSETSMSFFTDPNEHELSLTVTFSHGQKCLHNYHKLWHCLLHLITTPPPLPRDFLADSEKHELFLTVRLSRGQNPTNLEKVENYYKLWLFLWYLITLATPPPSPRDFLTGPDKHELSLTVRFSHDKNISTSTINYDFVCFAWLP